MALASGEWEMVPYCPWASEGILPGGGAVKPQNIYI